MKIQNIMHQKRYKVIALVCAGLATIAAAGLFTYNTYISKPWLIEGICADYGNIDLYLSPENTEAFADESPVIVIANALNPDAFDFEKFTEKNPLTPQLRVTEVVKGSRALKVGDVINLCPYSQVTFEGNNHTVALFLHGYTDSRWIPNTDHVGMIPQNSQGRFVAEWGDSFSISELREIVK